MTTAVARKTIATAVLVLLLPVIGIAQSSTPTTAPAPTTQGDSAMPSSRIDVAPDAAGFGPRELKAIEETLHAINLKPADLGYRKGPLPADVCRLPIIESMMHDPLSIPARTGDLLAPMRKKQLPSAQLARLAAELPGGKDLDISSIRRAKFELGQYAASIPDWLLPTIARLAGAYQASRVERDRAFAHLKPEERAMLLDNINGFLQDEDLGFKLDESIQKDPAPYWKLLESVKYEHIWRSGLYMMKEIELACNALDKARDQWKEWKGVARVDKVVIAGPGHNRHEDKAEVIIDLGGENTYVGEATQAWIVNFGGGNRYKAPAVSLGAGVLDCRVIWDREGGNFYEATAMTQGYGAFGIGMLICEGGSNTYRADIFSQGAARTWGAGLLGNRGGHNIYRSGGKYINKPLLEREGFTYSMSQGFAIGFRGDNSGTPSRSGGIGLLWSGDGYNTYTGSTYCQGASYWFALGALCDDGGNNRFTANYYSQASAMHMTVAALLVAGSHNQYTIDIGASHAIGHDWGIAMLWNKGGNNVCAAGGAAAGTGVANGIGIFVTSAGGNSYMLEGPASAGPARDSGSVAMFVEVGAGKSRYYNRAFGDGKVKLDKSWGVARSFVEEPAPTPATGPATTQATPNENPQKHHAPLGSRALADEPELEKLWTQATQWAVGSARDSAWQARWQLIEMGLPAAKWIAEKKLPVAQSLTYECLDPLFMEYGPQSHKYIVEAMRSKDVQTVQNALRLAFDIKAADTAPEVLRIIKDSEKLRRMAVAVAGAIRVKEAAPLIIRYCDEKNPMSQLGAAQSLAKIADASSLDWLLAHVRGTELPVREACGDALAKIGASALPRVLELAKDKDLAAARLALRVLGELDKPQCLTALQEKASDADWGVRISALCAMRAMKLPAAKGALAACLAKEKDARVLSAIGSLDVEPQK